MWLPFFAHGCIMQLLTAVNLMLPKLGEHPVTSLDTKHPTVAIILPEVDNELLSVLIKGWWFNAYEYTAYPDSEKHITLGTDTLSFVPAEVDAALRAQRLFNPTNLSYTWDAPVKGVIIQRVEFEELPETVAQHVWYSALVNAFVTDLGMSEDVKVWKAKADAAYTDMLAEHLRHKKYSTSKSPRFRRLRCALEA